MEAVYRVYDVDGDKLLTREEVQHITKVLKTQYWHNLGPVYYQGGKNSILAKFISGGLLYYQGGKNSILAKFTFGFRC